MCIFVPNTGERWTRRHRSGHNGGENCVWQRQLFLRSQVNNPCYCVFRQVTLFCGTLISLLPIHGSTATPHHIVMNIGLLMKPHRRTCRGSRSCEDPEANSRSTVTSAVFSVVDLNLKARSIQTKSGYLLFDSEIKSWRFLWSTRNYHFQNNNARQKG